MGEARAVCPITLKVVVPDILVDFPSRQVATTLIDGGIWGLVFQVSSLRSMSG
jgi:hypothetical protein